MPENNICPYCKETLQKEIKRKSSCTSCGKDIYVREGELMTKADKVLYDTKKRISDMGISGIESAKNTDEIWGMLNQKIMEYSQKKRFDDVSRVYLQMGIITFDEGKYRNCISNYLLCTHFASLHMALEDREYNIKTSYRDLLGAGNYMISNPVTESIEKLQLKNVTVEKLGKLAVTPTLTVDKKLKILEDAFNGETRRLDGIAESIDEKGKVEEIKFEGHYHSEEEDIELNENETECPHCGITLRISGAGTYKCPECKNTLSVGGVSKQNKTPIESDDGITCPKCGSNRVVVQNETEMHVEHRGCLSWLLWILAAVLTFGLILIIPLVTNSKVKSKSSTVAVCQKCGCKWKI